MFQDIAIIIGFIGWWIMFGMFCGIYVRAGRTAAAVEAIADQLAERAKR